MHNIYLAIKTVLKVRRNFLIFLITTVIFFGLFIIIPVLTIPGNSTGFQLSIFRTRDYVLMVFLSLLVGLNIAFGLYNWQQKRSAKQIESLAQGAVTGTLGIFGAVVGTAACASCLASLFGLIGLGTGSLFFVLENQSYFLFGAIALMLVSLHFAARKVNRVCSSC